MSEYELLKAQLRSGLDNADKGADGLRELGGVVLSMKEAAAAIEALEAKLATCEKYRDAYAEMDRIGTQAVRDLEAKLAKAVEALRWQADQPEAHPFMAIAARTALAEVEGS
jgi:hypothetical protein